MAETLKVPVFGDQKKTTVYVVGGAVVLFLTVAAVRARGKNSSATASTATTAANPAGTDVNPATGYPYGSPEDAQAMAANSAYQNPTSYGGGGGPASTPAPSTGFTSNAQWEQAAVQYLTDTVGMNPATVSSALGKFIGGRDVVKGSADESIILQAIAAEGQPPQGGDKGFPPGIRYSAAPTTHPATALGTPRLKIAKLTRPPVVRKGRHPTGNGTALLQWTRVTGAEEYELLRNGVHIDSTIHTGINVHTDGQYRVIAAPKAGDAQHKPSAASNIVTVNV